MSARGGPGMSGAGGGVAPAGGPGPTEGGRELFERHGAILSGHFLLSSGRHSDRYVQTARLMERPDVAMRLAQEMASWYGAIDVVLAPAVGAVALGFAVALAAGSRSVWAEREGGRMRLRRGFGVEPGERALVVENVVTTGGSAGEVFELAGRMGAERLGVAALVDRSASPPGFPLRAVLRLEAVSWEPEDCPLCGQGRPLDAPGSRRIGGP
jgi:orotate phosphoribosyltransferase